MALLTIVILLASLNTPALAAGGFEDMPVSFALAFYSTFALLFGLPSVGLGYFLQAFFRLRNAVIFLSVVALAFLVLLAGSYGLEKTLQGLPSLTILLLLFAPLFGLGWYIGIRVAKRTTRRSPA